MSAYFAVQYTIHFDDTMAYGSHHFLTGFKFQCASREAFLFGERIFDLPDVKESLDRIHLLTLDAYSRNLDSARLGDRIAILLSIEEWGQASARFCYRAVDSHGRRICAGFQLLVSADAASGGPCSLPEPLRAAMDAMREIEEPRSELTFRERVLAGGKVLDEVFDERVCKLAVEYLKSRYPRPEIIRAVPNDPAVVPPELIPPSELNQRPKEAWIFAGQGAFNVDLFKNRIHQSLAQGALSPLDLSQCIAIVQETLGGSVNQFFEGSREETERALQENPALSQVGIHLQNVLGAELRSRRLQDSAVGEEAAARSLGLPERLVGHSFGEIAACAFGGCLSLLDGVRAVCSRSQAVSTFAPPDRGLLAVLASRERVVVEVTLSSTRDVVVAGRNHDRQTVLSGPNDQLDLMREILKARGIQSVFVASPTSFHHPDLRGVAQHWLVALRQLRWHAPRIPVYSPIGRRFLLPTDDIPQILATQLLRPFDFQGALQDIAFSGITHFVDCGSKGSLATLIAQAGHQQWNVIRCDDEFSSVEASAIDGCPTVCNCAESVEGAEIAATTFNRTSKFKSASETNESESNALGKSRRIEEHDSAIAIVGVGCILPAGSTSPEKLLQAIESQELGIVDMRDSDPSWEQDFYSANLQPDRSTSFLFGRVRDRDLVPPEGIDPLWFESLTRTQKLL